MRSLQALLALFACAVLPLHAAGLDDLTWTTTGGEVTITDCNTAATGELVIPPTIEDHPVTSIGFGAFYRCSSLRSIIIPDSVTSIGPGAFIFCSSLTSVTFLGTAPTVGADAFLGVRRGAVAIVSGEEQGSFGGTGAVWNGLIVECIGGALCWLTWTTTNDEVIITDCDEAATGELVIPTTIGGKPVTSIGNSAFRDCTSLTSITIPDSVTSIGVIAFRDCTSLTSITIPDSVTSIGDDAFRNCSSLTNITFLGTAPAVGVTPFFGVSEEAQALVQFEFAEGFGGFESTWEGLTVASQRPFAITACGFVNATTFFIEFEPAGAGYRVMSSPTLDFGNAVEVAPTLEPTSTEDNRFEFAASGSRNFYRLEPTE